MEMSVQEAELDAVMEAAVRRTELVESATAGLTDEQVAAIPRLVAMWTRHPDAAVDVDEIIALRKLFPWRVE